MDELAEKTQKTKVLTKKLKNATQDIAQLDEERSLVKGYRVFLVSGDSTKQGEDEEEKRKTETDRKDNEDSGSGKDKGKGISKDDNEENTMISESERIAREK
ncbi:unnamed protein product [Lactuca saligna]|uniref:Uncharacterized protein n=1 Tax=Lactuca saligna TaxID=75948 RepID=A0AA36EP05_LACSI|nr:unnamed protein product [Lactuca saligna]